MIKKRCCATHGNILILLLVLTSMLVMIALGAFALVSSQSRLAAQQADKQITFEIAEAGVEYYRWHLAHVPDDFISDIGEHEYKNALGEVIGSYTIDVIPPAPGSTIVIIQSTGWTTNHPLLKRTISAQLGIPSFATYAVIANDFMRFGAGTEIFGPIHSNDGIRFDGVAHNVVSSAKETFTDPDTHHVEDGVYTTESNESTVFLAGKEFPVPAADFNGITADLASLKTKANTGGIYLPSSGADGYHIVLKTDNTVDITKVTSQATCRYRIWFRWHALSDEMWSIQNESAFTYQSGSSLHVTIPENGIIFAEDDVWVDGQINGSKITIVAAEEPLVSGSANIIVNKDLLYTSYDGSDVIGLIAQNDFHIGFYSADTFRIDAAIIAQKGRVGRPYYGVVNSSTWSPAGCNAYVHRDTVTIWGSLATNHRYGFAYTDGTGYQTRNLNFDSELTFGPPPSFPTTDQYSILSWEEL